MWRFGRRLFNEPALGIEPVFTADGFVILGKLVLLPQGAIGVRKLNKTGVDSVKGTVVTTHLTVERAVDIIPADIPKPMGIIFEEGIPDGGYVTVIQTGSAQVLLENSTSATMGYWVKVSDNDDGRVDITNEFPPGGTITAIQDHLSECGHCEEDVTAGTDKLAWITVHFL